MKLKLAGIAITGAVAAAMLIYAQPPGRGFRGAAATGDAPAPPADAVKTYLALTDSQLTGFQAIRATARTASEPIAEQLRTKMQALRTARNANPVDSAAVSALQAEVTALQAQLDKIQADARAQMAALLSADQKAKLATLTAAAALRAEIAGASMLGLLEGGPGFAGRGGGPGGGKGKGGRGGKGF